MIDIVYIAGCGRSGSTLLDNVLGQAPGCFSGGELWHIWRRGLVENRRCGDGVPFRQHPFWRAVFERGFGGMDSLPLERILAQEARALDVARRYPLLAAGSVPPPPAGIEAYLDALSRLYRAIAETAGCDSVVDCSKYPVYALLLSRLPQVRLRLLHLVRDPRAVVHSWSRSKAQPDRDGSTDARGMLWSILQWRLANAAAETLGRVEGMAYRQLRYEDLVAAPRRSIAQLDAWLGLRATASFVGEDHVLMKPNYAFSGNPSRFRSGLVRLAADEAWRRDLPDWKAGLVAALAGPARARYGYPRRLAPARSAAAVLPQEGA